MQNRTILAAICLLSVVATFVAIHSVQRLDVRVPQKLAVDRFPRVIGTWRASEDVPVHPEVRKTLKDATIVDRMYTDAAGRSVRLLLVSSSRAGDIHNPQVCLPGQGWHLVNRGVVTRHDFEIHRLTAESDYMDLDVYYWITGGRALSRDEGEFVKAVRAIRSRLVPADEGRSLLVRIAVPRSGHSEAVLNEFLRTMLPPLDAMITQGQVARGRSESGGEPSPPSS